MTGKSRNDIIIVRKGQQIGSGGKAGEELYRDRYYVGGLTVKREGKKKNSQQWIGMLLYMLIGASSGILFLRFFEQHKEEEWSIVKILLLFGVVVLVLYGSIMIQIIIHEAGHLVFGLVTGYRFSSFRIFGWMWLKKDGRLQVKHLSLAGTGGQCLMAPPELRNGKMPVLLYNFGGAIMNLIASAIFAGLSFLFPVSSVFNSVFLILAVVGIGFAIINGVPLHMGPVDNDGCNALSLMRSEEACRAFWIQLKANEKISEGIRLKDMPAEWFVVPEDDAMKNGIIASVGVLACSRLMDEQRFAEADERMEHLLSIESGIAGLHRSLMICDRVFMELIGQNRPEVLDSMLTREQKKLMKAMNKYPSILRTRYVYALLAQHDETKAREIKAAFERSADRYPYPSEIEGEKELMETAEKQAAKNGAD